MKHFTDGVEREQVALTNSLTLSDKNHGGFAVDHIIAQRRMMNRDRIRGIFIGSGTRLVGSNSLTVSKIHNPA
jgi:hypothetical protein